jgi:hypothetical protein
MEARYASDESILAMQNEADGRNRTRQLDASPPELNGCGEFDGMSYAEGNGLGC